MMADSMETKKGDFDYEALKKTLEEAIQHAEPKKKDIELNEDDFFGKLEHEIINKEAQGTEKKDEAYLIWDEDSRYENLEDKDRAFKFTNSYEQQSSFSLTKTKGWSIGLGANLGGGAMGAAAGVGVTARYGRGKSATVAGSSGEMKTLELTGEVKPDHVATVMELAYRERRYRICDIILSTNKDTEVSYYHKKEEEEEKVKENIKMENLIKQLIKTKQIKNEGDRVTFHLKGECKFTCITHALRVSQAKISDERLEKIKKPVEDELNTKPVKAEEKMTIYM